MFRVGSDSRHQKQVCVKKKRTKDDDNKKSRQQNIVSIGNMEIFGHDQRAIKIVDGHW